MVKYTFSKENCSITYNNSVFKYSANIDGTYTLIKDDIKLYTSKEGLSNFLSGTFNESCQNIDFGEFIIYWLMYLSDNIQ